MKKIISLLIVTAALLTVLTSCNSAPAPDGFKLASEDIADYYFYVPTNWKIDTQTGVTSAHYSDTDPTNISVAIYASVADVENSKDYYNETRNSITSLFGVINEELEADTTLGGSPAYKIVYTTKINNVNYRIMQIYCLRGEMVYVVTYTATEDKYEEHYDKVELMLSHFAYK